MTPYLASSEGSKDELGGSDTLGQAVIHNDQFYPHHQHPDISTQGHRNAEEEGAMESVFSSHFSRGKEELSMRRRRRLQHYLRTIKNMVKEEEQGATDQQKRTTKLSTMDALERAVQLLRTTLGQKNNRSCDVENEEENVASSVPSPPAAEVLPNNFQALQESISQSPSPPSVHTPNRMKAQRMQTASVQQGRRFLGSLLVCLPEGTVIESRPSSSDSDCITRIVQPGDCLFDLLHGKGAQTLLLNAFCGHAKRRMYARLKWGETPASVRACEFLCEFSVDSGNPAMRMANIQVFCVRSTLLPLIQHSSAGFPTSNNIPQQRGLSFTIRHNSSCALIFVDSASIPVLGHFPSEITGKSLFALVHSEDVEIVKTAHKQLREACSSGQVVSTPGLRLINYSGGVVRVDSEWSAFQNPWTHQIEMIVSRHICSSLVSELQQQKEMPNKMQLDAEQLRFHDSFVHGILSKPISGRELNVPKNSEEEKMSNVGTKKNSLGNDGHCSLNSSTSPQETLRKISSSSLPEDTIEQRCEPNSAQEICLSYNQINCLENVHRLLKSQAKETEKSGGVDHKQTEVEETKIKAESDQQIAQTEVVSPLLTREILAVHDQKWEQECKDSWKRRLSLKRISQSPIETKPIKMMKRTISSADGSPKLIKWNGQIRGNNSSRTGNLTPCESPLLQTNSIVNSQVPSKTASSLPSLTAGLPTRQSLENEGQSSQEPTTSPTSNSSPFQFGPQQPPMNVSNESYSFNAIPWTEYLAAAIQAQLQLVSQHQQYPTATNQSTAASQSLIFAMLQGLSYNHSSSNILAAAECDPQIRVDYDDENNTGNIRHSGTLPLPNFQ